MKTLLESFLKSFAKREQRTPMLSHYMEHLNGKRRVLAERQGGSRRWI